MKSKEEIRANINGVALKLHEHKNNQIRAKSVMTPEMYVNFEKTRFYMEGWIDALSESEQLQNDTSYKLGFDNAIKWKNQ